MVASISAETNLIPEAEKELTGIGVFICGCRELNMAGRQDASDSAPSVWTAADASSIFRMRLSRSAL